MTNYTLGFLFNKTLEKVVLIRKLKPDWQKGKLNGIGGHVEMGEGIIDCQEREFREETTYEDHLDWRHFAFMQGRDFHVDCFAAIGNIDNIKAKTKEEIVIINVSDIEKHIFEMLDNIPWLIYMAIDVVDDNRPNIAKIYYDI